PESPGLAFTRCPQVRDKCAEPGSEIAVLFANKLLARGPRDKMLSLPFFTRQRSWVRVPYRPPRKSTSARITREASSRVTAASPRKVGETFSAARGHECAATLPRLPSPSLRALRVLHRVGELLPQPGGTFQIRKQEGD